MKIYFLLVLYQVVQQIINILLIRGRRYYLIKFLFKFFCQFNAYLSKIVYKI